MVFGNFFLFVLGSVLIIAWNIGLMVDRAKICRYWARMISQMTIKITIKKTRNAGFVGVCA